MDKQTSMGRVESLLNNGHGWALFFFVQLQSIVPIKLAWSVFIFFSWCIVSFPIGFGTYSMYVYTIYTPVIDTPITILQLRVFGVLLILSYWLPSCMSVYFRAIAMLNDDVLCLFAIMHLLIPVPPGWSSKLKKLCCQVISPPFRNPYSGVQFQVQAVIP